MDTKTIIILGVAAVVLFAALGMVLARRKKSEQHHGQFKTEYDLTVKTMGGEKQAQAELDERQKHVDAMALHALKRSERLFQLHKSSVRFPTIPSILREQFGKDFFRKNVVAQKALIYTSIHTKYYGLPWKILKLCRTWTVFAGSM